MKKGDKVIIKSTSNTTQHIGLDGKGEMKSMVGKRFPLNRVTSTRAYIKGPKSDYEFTWHIKDVMFAEKLKEPDPQIFHFNIENLTT